MKTSLIITTYNWKEALDLTLKSVVRQSEPPDEVLVADDGSKPDTAALVSSWSPRLSAPLVHVWQEDEGFRLARSRNRAIAAATGDYIVIVDGDMALHRHFIADHKRAAQRGFFIQGARALTDAAMGRRMLDNGIIDVGFFSSGVRRRRHTIRNRFLSWLVYQHVRTDQKAIRGSNQGYWRDDLVRVNGFDETMTGWGGEDNEIAARLYHTGIKRRQLKFAALATHIYHASRQPEGDTPNGRILDATVRTRKKRCELGLNQHMITELASRPG